MIPEGETPQQRKVRDSAQRWLDFGSWLSGEVSQVDFARRDGLSPVRYHQLFTKIMDIYFQDIRRDASLLREQWLPVHFRNRPMRQATLEEARKAMHPRFVEAVHLAFGRGKLSDIAASQPDNIYRLVKRLRADFGLMVPKEISSDGVIRVLHLEDSAEDAEIIESILLEEWPLCQFQRVWKRADYENALKQGEFNLILSDHSMPGFDGLSALELARQHSPRKPFIFLSGTIGEERAVEAIKRGATDYIMKDHPNRLVSAIRQALENR